MNDMSWMGRISWIWQRDTKLSVFTAKRFVCTFLWFGETRDYRRGSLFLFSSEKQFLIDLCVVTFDVLYTKAVWHSFYNRNTIFERDKKRTARNSKIDNKCSCIGLTTTEKETRLKRVSEENIRLFSENVI